MDYMRFVYEYSNVTNNNSLTKFMMNVDDFMDMSNEDIVKTAKNAGGSKLVRQYIQQHKEVHEKFYKLLLNPDNNTNDSFLIRLSCDINGNFIIQKLIEIEFAATAGGTKKLFQAIKEVAFQLALNRYGCRVVQKVINLLPANDVRELLKTNFVGKEFQLVTDQNGNHTVQQILMNHTPDVYAEFIKSMVNSVGLCQIVQDRYASRVIHYVFDRIIETCEDKNSYSEAKNAAFEILENCMESILKNAHKYAKNEYANYLIQYILKTEFFYRQRKYIIKEHLCNNILALSQNKYASHVVEIAFEKADDTCLKALFYEVLEGYKPDHLNRTALHILLFNQYGNYVAQRMLDVALQVRLGQRKGDTSWFDSIALYAYNVRQKLAKYSSGKKILGTLQSAYEQLYNTSFYTTTMVPRPLLQLQ